MPRPDWAFALAAAAALVSVPAFAGGGEFGRTATAADLAGMVAISPTGAGLPPGHGTVEQGQAVYAGKCAACHGDALQGVKSAGGPALIGGRGTLASAKPVRTVESYWPYATTLFDYVRRAMPFNAPGSLTDDEVYAVSAYILAEGHVIASPRGLDAATLATVAMPNAHGFVPDPRPK